MHVAQSGIFALGTSSHSYLEFDLYAQGDPLTLVQVMASLEEPRMTTGGPVLDGGKGGGTESNEGEGDSQSGFSANLSGLQVRWTDVQTTML